MFTLLGRGAGAGAASRSAELIASGAAPCLTTSPCPRMRPFRNGVTRRRPWRHTAERMSTEHGARDRARTGRFATSDWLNAAADQNNPRRRQRRWSTTQGGGAGGYSRQGLAQRLAGSVHRGPRLAWRPTRETRSHFDLTRGATKGTVATSRPRTASTPSLLYAYKHSTNGVLLHRLTFLWKINIHFPRV